MNSYSLHIESQITEEQLQNGLFIFMLRATRIPPHLGIIYNGKLYDITLVGPNIGLDVNDFMVVITKKYTKTVFIELEAPKVNTDLEKLLTLKMLKYECVSSSVSCLSPIKEFVSEVYDIDVDTADFIFDLLPILEMNAFSKNAFHLNCDRNLTEGTLKLIKYTQDDIDQCMLALNRKEVIC